MQSIYLRVQGHVSLCVRAGVFVCVCVRACATRRGSRLRVDSLFLKKQYIISQRLVVRVESGCV